MFESFLNNQILMRTMTLTGQGRVTAPPDTAVIRLGVEQTGNDLSSAQTRNAQLTQAVLDSLQNIKIDDIRTVEYTINKNYEYDNGTPIDRGYTVRNILEIRTDNIGLAGTIIDTAVSAGANVVEMISFESSEPEAYYGQALNLAVMDAMDKAKSISTALNVPLDPVPASITENSSIPVRPQPLLREAADTPVIPGDINIEANITAEFFY